MKNLILIVVVTFLSATYFSQKTFDPRKKKKYFGGTNNEVKKLSNIGLEINVGPTFTLASLNKMDHSQNFVDASGNPVTLDISQKGSIGANIEIGLAHYNMKSPKFSFGRIVDYFDYGLGFKYFRGNETTKMDINRNITESKGEMANGYLGLRVAVHKLTYFKNSSLYLDNALGLNGDYLLLEKSRVYDNMNTINQKFSNSMHVNLHYAFGLGIRLKRGSYLTPSVYAPILAFQEFGKESIHWFSSRYYPLTCQIKFTKLLGKKSKKTDCSTNGSEEDKKKNKEYMQNK
ncbi:MAG: hypothetical protein V4622_01385 [Bacteroidota bacterium]